MCMPYWGQSFGFLKGIRKACPLCGVRRPLASLVCIVPVLPMVSLGKLNSSYHVQEVWAVDVGFADTDAVLLAKPIAQRQFIIYIIHDDLLWLQVLNSATPFA